MQLEVVVVLSVFINFAVCNNTNKQQRLFSFNTDDETGDVSVELAFNVPFLKIPVKKSVDSVKGAVANVNVGAVALTGGLILATVGLFPAVSWLLSKKNHESDYTYRNADDTTMVDFLTEQQKTCLQKIICWSVKRSTRKVQNGNGDSMDKIIDGLVSSEWLQDILNGTALKASVKNAMQGVNCAKEYADCKISRNDLNVLFGESD